MITVTDTEVQVQGNNLIKHDWYWHNRIPVLVNILYQLRDEFSSKRLHIDFPDGEPMVYSGIDHIIDLIQNELNLDPGKFVITTHNHDYQNPRVTVKYRNSAALEFVRKFFKFDHVRPDPDAVMFGGMFGRYTLERFLLASFLGTEINQDSFVIFQPTQKYVDDELSLFGEYYAKELQWNRSRVQPEIAVDTSHSPNGALNGVNPLEDYAVVQKKYQIDVIAETDCHNRYFVTEKTAKCLAFGKPFVLFGGCGALEYLRSLGFRTFDPIVNESYDLEPCVNRRLNLVKEEIYRIANLSNSDQQSMISELNTIADYNRNNYDRIVNRIRR